MARDPQQFNRVAEFWDRHAQSSHFIDEKSLAILRATIDAVEGKPTFGLEHIQAYTLAISVCEAQIRDCIRLAFDTPSVPIDADNFLLKNVRPDYALLNSIRDRHVSLGEFCTKIRSELDELDTVLRNSRPPPEWYLPETSEVRKAIAAFRAAHSDYLFRLGDFYALVHGPGTIVNDFIYAAHLRHLKQFEKEIAWALHHSHRLRDP